MLRSLVKVRLVGGMFRDSVTHRYSLRFFGMVVYSGLGNREVGPSIRAVFFF